MKKELIVQRNPKSPISEMFRTLRTNIQFMNAQKNLKTILITSTMPNEGKSWIASNLAITFAKTGKKVLLIDADMRKGRMASLFQVNKVPGLSNLLSGIDEKGRDENRDISNYINKTEIENLFVMPSGNVPPNPAELLEDEKTAEVLNKFKEIFDIIILDGTPSLLVTDAIILSKFADTTLLVVSHKLTQKEDIVKVKRLFENVGEKISGVILNRMPIKAKQYNYSYYYGSKSATKSKHERVEENNIGSINNISESKQEEILSQLNKYKNRGNN